MLLQRKNITIMEREIHSMFSNRIKTNETNHDKLENSLFTWQSSKCTHNMYACTVKMNRYKFMSEIKLQNSVYTFPTKAEF